MVCQNQLEPRGTCTDSGKGTENLYKPPNHNKKVAAEKKHKSTQRGTVSCNSCVFTHNLF